jgi:hypothetical protein
MMRPNKLGIPHLPAHRWGIPFFPYACFELKVAEPAPSASSPDEDTNHDGLTFTFSSFIGNIGQSASRENWVPEFM